MPVFVTEHGVAVEDDTLRAGFIEPSLAGLLDAIEDGVPVLGYCHWTPARQLRPDGRLRHLPLRTAHSGQRNVLPCPEAERGRVRRHRDQPECEGLGAAGRAAHRPHPGGQRDGTVHKGR